MSKVLSEDEIYELEVAIYNDDNKALFKSLPQGVEDFNDQGMVKELAQGQEYYMVPQSNIMVRKDGRLFNVKFIRVIKPIWTPVELTVNISGKTVKFSEIYKSQGWKFDQKEIAERYAKNKWGVTVNRAYRDLYKELYLSK